MQEEWWLQESKGLVMAYRIEHVVSESTPPRFDFLLIVLLLLDTLY